MNFPRSSGILLHPTSLPGKFGIGDLGPEAYDLVERLASARQALWQILPLGPTGYGDSPYQSFSAFAGNPLLISPELLIKDGLISETDLANAPSFSTTRVDFGEARKWKAGILETAFEGFTSMNDEALRGSFESYCRTNKEWLDDYALYRAIKTVQVEKPWYEWPVKFKLRDERTISVARQQLEQKIDAERFVQWIFSKQWTALRRRANDLGISVIGDLPIFVALDSADVWRRRDQFKLNDDGSPKVVAGVPPDYFSKTGQLWGNPIYDWDAMSRDKFAWWVERFRSAFATVDIVRVDHFRGFDAVWEVPGTDDTAEKGSWVSVPGREIFASVVRQLGKLNVIAEDLGVMTPEVEKLRDDLGFPGMRILQYAFGGDAGNRDLPHNYIKNCAAYTGTHDNETTRGWWTRILSESETDTAAKKTRDHCLEYLKSDGADIVWDMIRAVWSSVADVAIAPMQDILRKGNDARMNTPATDSGNWTWRVQKDEFSDEMIGRLRKMTELYGRVR
jgi:4-alpha-glucanotransferase